MLEIFQRIFLKKENAVVIGLFKVEYLIKLDNYLWNRILLLIVNFIKNILIRLWISLQTHILWAQLFILWKEQDLSRSRIDFTRKVQLQN